MFGKRLKELRLKANLLQRELALKMKLSPTTITMYELGKREPDNETLKEVADFFNVSTDYLLGRTDDPNIKILTEKDLPPELVEEGLEAVAVLKDHDLTVDELKKLLETIKELNKKARN